ncbi:glycosyltransferase family protein [Halostella litorea]|uniref:glycosyl transferase family 2 n=1 Tax=Halostella litorea TaxID=2528831 RepID=UPI0010929BED|nr:glycosyl transferase family 2 [Halostella litorea]
MEYVQERIATLHAFDDPTPAAPTDRSAVVVPMTDREHAGLAAERVLSTLAEVSPERVVVPLRSPADRVPAFAEWLDSFDAPTELLWCNAPGVEAVLDDAGLDDGFGKGRDVWLALGVASETADYVVVHDADATTYSAAHVPRLLAPLADGHAFSKGYYARVENGRLYGRLFRLFYAPLVRALSDAHDAPVLDYLAAFRYALAGEFAVTADLARDLRAQRAWGLEVGTLGDAFAHAGFDGTAQVDLGRHEHDHRSVSGPTGLADMARQVGAALFRVVEEHGVAPDYDALPERYRDAAGALVRQYAADARFNGLDYDAAAEREQVAEYRDAVRPPGPDDRLPAWSATSIAPEAVADASAEAVERVTGRDR